MSTDRDLVAAFAASEPERALYPRVRRWLSDTAWAILPGKLAVLIDVLELRAQGITLTAEEMASRIGAAPPRPPPPTGSSIAVLPLLGVIAQRAGLLAESSGGTSTERFAQVFRQAVGDPRVAAIVLDVDSPGGAVFGIPELAEEIYRARGSKPVVAVANSLAASAAYWIATAADELSITPSGEVGAIGVLAVHEDLSQARERLGVRTTLISAGKFKAEGNPFEALSDEGRAHIQERVNDYYGQFTAAVARHRGLPARQVRSGFGEGRLVGAQQALALGMADRVETLDQTLARLARARDRPSASTRASTHVDQAGRWSSSLNVGGEDGELLTAENVRLAIPLAGAIPPHSTPKAPEDAPWDAAAEVAQAEGRAQLRRMHAWVDDDGDPDAKSSYKLPHHRASGEVVWRGVAAAAGALAGARGGVQIPDEDRPGVRAHLGRHYRQFDRTPPWEEESQAGQSEQPGEPGQGAGESLELRRRRWRWQGGLTVPPAPA